MRNKVLATVADIVLYFLLFNAKFMYLNLNWITTSCGVLEPFKTFSLFINFVSELNHYN